jgi:hypothetical protein
MDIYSMQRQCGYGKGSNQQSIEIEDRGSRVVRHSSRHIRLIIAIFIRYIFYRHNLLPATIFERWCRLPPLAALRSI